ncbi:MAG: hypothetical protein QW815_05160 [Nitrososphaerota archaeon]
MDLILAPLLTGIGLVAILVLFRVFKGWPGAIEGTKMVEAESKTAAKAKDSVHIDEGASPKLHDVAEPKPPQEAVVEVKEASMAMPSEAITNVETPVIKEPQAKPEEGHVKAKRRRQRAVRKKATTRTDRT